MTVFDISGERHEVVSQRMRGMHEVTLVKGLHLGTDASRMDCEIMKYVTASCANTFIGGNVCPG